MLELVCGWSDINGAYPVWLFTRNCMAERASHMLLTIKNMLEMQRQTRRWLKRDVMVLEQIGWLIIMEL